MLTNKNMCIYVLIYIYALFCDRSGSIAASQNLLLSAVIAEQQDDGTGKEVILDDSECPLQIFRDWPADRGDTPTQSATILFFSKEALVVPLFFFFFFFFGLYCPLQLPVYYYSC